MGGDPDSYDFIGVDIYAHHESDISVKTHALGFKGYVKSPSYGLLESYAVSGITVLHLDLYRIEDPEELDYLALRDLYDEKSVLMVEWPRKGVDHLPEPDLELEFFEDTETRFISSFAKSIAGFGLNRKVLLDL